MMKQTRTPLVLPLLLTVGMAAMCAMPVQADQEDAAMKAVADRMKQSDAFAEELRRKREERRLEAERQAQQGKGAEVEKKVEPAPVVQAPKPVTPKAGTSTSSAAERKAQEAERKAQEAERKAQEAERKAKEAMARAEQAEKDRLAMQAEQRAREEALKAQALAIQQQQPKPAVLAAPKKDDAWSRIPDECRDPVGTAAEIERLCGPAPGSINREAPKEAKKETAPSAARK
jgi:hypothetical protein